jgi:hypothetical protein
MKVVCDPEKVQTILIAYHYIKLQCDNYYIILVLISRNITN